MPSKKQLSEEFTGAEVQQVPREYHQVLQPVPGTPWRSALALTALTGSISGLVLSALPISNALDRLFLGSAPNAVLAAGGAGAAITFTPGLLLANNLLLTASIPISLIIERVIYKKPWGSLSSVENKFRWDVAADLAKVIVPAITLYYGGALALFKPAGWPDGTANSLAMASIVLTTIPLQSAAEEYTIRGLLQRITSSWFGPNESISFWASTVFTSLSFASMHMSRGPWNNLYYVVAGVCASLMTRWTGGLEASVLVHAASNVVILLPMMLAGNMELLAELATGNGAGPVIIVPIAGLIGLTWYIGERAKETSIKNLEE